MLRKRFRNIFLICYTDSMKKKQIKGIDGIRALAIIGVTAFHFFPDLFKGGYMGVCLFFIVTGFPLPSVHIKSSKFPISGIIVLPNISIILFEIPSFIKK